MEDVVMKESSAFWKSRRVLVTGHTGFKGGWLALWLNSLGAEVHGISLPPESSPNLFESASIGDFVSSRFVDIRDQAGLSKAVRNIAPEFIFHLAAQPLVRHSYQEPVETFATNVMGTVHLLEAIRKTSSVAVVVVVTSDKCYENREWPWGYREIDPMGGNDPYSCSKGCAELVATSFFRSFFRESTSPRLATARAGNVIGGGDWSKDRLVPDLLAAFSSGKPVTLRYPNALRPWQHVLDPIGGYLALAENLFSGQVPSGEGWNFGPNPNDVCSVGHVADTMARLWGAGATVEITREPQPHEAGALALDCSKARGKLGWRPRLPLETALQWTIDWQRESLDGKDMRACTLRQIQEFQDL